MRRIFALLVCLLSSAALFAQFDTATVLGTVKDRTDAVVSEAKITLTNSETGISVVKDSDANGGYEFFNVRVGRYKVKAEKTGFATAIAEDFQVTVSARQRVDLTLAVGQVAESVEVSANVSLVESDSSQRGQVISTRQIVELPLNGRNYSSLVLLSTGVRNSALSTGGFTPREGSFNVNGLRSTFNNFLLDGLDNNAYGTSNQGFSNQVMQPSPDAVQEFQVVTNNMSAEYGRTGGAVVNVAYRSGTNDFHGAAWEFLRNTNLNAVGFFKPRNNVKPTLNRNQFGFTFGGPIVKNRAFFFTDYEGFRQVRGYLDFGVVPPLDQRQGIFTTPIRNPATKELFPNNTVPQSMITGFARKVLADLPAPNTAGANNYSRTRRFDDKTDKYNVKLDYLLSNKLNGFVRVGQRKVNQLDEALIPGPSGGDSNGNLDVLNQQLATSLTWTRSSTELFDFRLGISRTRAGKEPLGLGAATMRDVYGIPGLPTDPRVAGGLTAQIITGFANIGRQATNPQWQYPTLWNPKSNWSKFLGRHSIKAGYEYQRVHTEIQDVNPLYGRDAYTGGANFTGAPLADFLLGLRTQYALTNFLVANYQQYLHFGYLQDDWKVNSRLTLNLGLRYEFATPQWERDNLLTNFDPARLTMIQAKDGSLYDRSLIDPDKNNWAPRVGLAYSLSQKTVIRTGFGMNYVHFHRAGGGNILAINGPQVITAVVSQTDPLAPGYRNTLQGYPEGLTDPKNFNPLLANITYMPRDTRTSYVMSWFFSVQREIAKDTLIDVAYVANRANKLLLFADYNQALTQVPGQPLRSLQARRPIQSFSDITYAFNGGWSNYNSLQARFERRFSQLFVLNSFTYSKAMDNGSGALEGPNNNASAPQNVYDLAAEKGPSGYDQTLTNTTSVTWQLPFGKGRRFMADMPGVAEAVLGGWQLSGINSMWSGQPINLIYNPGADFQVSGIGPDWRGAPRFRPNVSGDPLTPEASRTPNNYLNPSTVLVPTDPTRPFGNAGRNIVRSHSYYSLDIAVLKDFAIVPERVKLQFRAEAFNLFNTTNFQAANGNRSQGSFGTITSTADPRQLQFALKLSF